MLTETLEYFGIAFISSVLLIIMSKIILQSLIRRPADYYDAEELRQEELMLNAGGLSIANEHETSPEGEIIEDTHLEPHLGAFVAAEPEPILAEIPESVIESIEPEHVHREKEEEKQDLISESVSEPIFESEPESQPEPEPAPVNRVTEPMAAEPSEVGFRINARTTRERKPIRKAGSKPAEPKKETTPEDTDQRGWDESYEEIRNSLEKAYKAGRKPSMRMNKAELIEIAHSKGLEVPEDYTKRKILDLIYAQEEK